MGMFGKQNASKWATIGATLSDVGESLGGGQGSALQQLAKRRQEDEAKRQREAYMAQFGELLGGQSVGEAPMTPGIDGSLDGMGPQAIPTAPKLPDQAAIIRRLMQAPEGVDTRSMLALYEASKPTAPKSPLEVGERSLLLDPVTYKPLYQPAAKPREAPAGYRWNADQTELQYIPGGPGDPRVVATRGAAGRALPKPKAAPRVQSMSTEQLLAALRGAK
jgi:hypothetical protein